jgi:hypothetical protein
MTAQFVCNFQICQFAHFRLQFIRTLYITYDHMRALLDKVAGQGFALTRQPDHDRPFSLPLGHDRPGFGLRGFVLRQVVSG